MAFDHTYFIGDNEILKAHHEQMVALYERAARWRYIAEFLCSVGEWEGQTEALFRAYEAHTAAERLLGLFGQVCSARDHFAMAVQWPRPNVREAEEQLLGVRKEPYYYGQDPF